MAGRAPIALALVACAAVAAAAATLPPGFRETVVLEGLHLPTVARFASDGRVFVAEKSGLVKVFDGLGDTSAEIFADLRTNVHSFVDRGLLGMALHPDFPATPYVYVLYTADAEIGGVPPRWGFPGATSDSCPTPPGTANGCVVSGRLSRLEASGNHMTGTETVLLENWCQQFQSHSVGALRFGPDGALYVSGGDGASYTATDYGQYGHPETNPCGDPPAGIGGEQTPATSWGGALRSQNIGLAGYGRAAFNGKLLRIDPITGAAFPGNPLAGSAVPGADRIIARGFRNPFRFALRPGTNEVWIGDVGWVDYEEIDRLVDPGRGVRNFGWPCYEGAEPQSAWSALETGVCDALYAAPEAVVTPWFRYHRSEPVVPGERCARDESSLSGLVFYEGGHYPARYEGALFFADYSRGCIWTMYAGAGGVPDPATRTTFAEQASGPVDLEIGPESDLFYVDIAEGAVRRIEWLGGVEPPVAAATADRTSGPVPLTVHFDATGSTDPDGAGPLSFSWDLDGDGTFGDATAPSPTHVYTSAGTYEVRVRVTDDDALSDTATIVVTAGNEPPVVTITSPLLPVSFAIGDVIPFAGTAVDPEDGPLPPSALSWSLVLEHCPGSCHSHAIEDFAGVAGGSFVAPDHEHPSHLELHLTATDSGGLSSSVTIELHPRTVTLLFTSVPPGLTLGAGTTGEPTPFERTVAAGSATLVSAPSPQLLDGIEYAFVEWSDGGAVTHDVTAGDANATFVARFTRTCELDAECADDDPCTDEHCADGHCVVAAKVCAPVDECHAAGTCDATGACVMPPLTFDGADCALDTLLTRGCGDGALPSRLRRTVEHRLARARTLLARVATGERPVRATATLHRVLRRLARRLGRTEGRIAEPCRAHLRDGVDELVALAGSLGVRADGGGLDRL